MFVRDAHEMPSTLQLKLARELAEPTEARVILSASDVRKLHHELVERAGSAIIDVPPLRHRRDDIEPIAQAFLGRATARHARDIRLASDAISALIAHSWSGNARELESAIDYAIAVTRGSSIHADDLPREISDVAVPRVVATDGDEATSIRTALETHHWNREATAAALGISRTTLWRKMRELGVR